MPNQAINSESPYGEGLVISPIKLSGPEQMALDVMILNQAKLDDFAMAVRFYHWDGVWLSIGRNQKNIPEKWFQLFLEEKINIVRRPSGGSAVLHNGGLTYSLVWKSAPRKKLQAYFLASKWLINCFKDLGLPLRFGNNPQNALSQNCFSLATQADLIDSYGNKRIGSAQFWKEGNLLQHGEILLDPPEDLWLQIFNTKPPQPVAEDFPRKNLDKFLAKSLMSYWPEISWQSKEILSKDLNKIKKASKDYLFFSVSEINPEEIIPSTNFSNESPNG